MVSKEEFKINLLSVLNTEKHGFEFRRLKAMYEELIGEKMPGHLSSIDQIAQTFPNDFRISHNNVMNIRVLKALPRPETQHIETMVRQQKTTKKRALPAKQPNPVKKLAGSYNITRSRPTIANRIIGHTKTQNHSYPLKSYHKSFNTPNTSNSFNSQTNVLNSPPSSSSPTSISQSQSSFSAQLTPPATPRPKSPSKKPSVKTETKNYRDMLLDLVNEKKLPQPKFFSYTTNTRSKSILYFSRVHIGDQSWTSHPESGYSPDDVENIASKKAFEHLSQNSDPLLGESITDEIEMRSLVDNIVEILKNDEFGALDYSVIPKKYNQTFGELIAGNWLAVIKTFPRDISIEVQKFTNLTKTTLALPTEAYLKSLDAQEISSKLEEVNDLKSEEMLVDEQKPPIIDSETTYQLLPPSLVLPNGQTWSVILLDVDDTNELTLRLFDTSHVYMDFLDKLSNYYENSDRYSVTVPMAGRIYAAVAGEAGDSTVLRVQVESFDGINTVRCVFVDEGGVEDLTMSCLREIPNEIAQIPFQAFRARLHGLGRFENDARIAKFIKDRIESEETVALVAQPVNRTEPIKIKLWDTTGEDDVILNEAYVTILKNLEMAKINFKR